MTVQLQVKQERGLTCFARLAGALHGRASGMHDETTRLLQRWCLRGQAMRSFGHGVEMEWHSGPFLPEQM